MSTLSYGEIFDRAWGKIRDRLPLVAGLTLLFLLVSSLLGSLPALGALLHGFFNVGYMVCLIKICDKNEMSFEDFFWSFTDFNRLLQLALLLVVMGLAICLGFVLLLIPGIYLCVAFSLAVPYFVVRKQDAMESLKASMQLTRDHWWSLAGLLFFIALLNLAGVLCFVLGLLVSVPMSVFILLEALSVLEENTGSMVSVKPIFSQKAEEKSDF